MKKQNELNMVSGPVAGAILRFSFPLMISAMLQIFFNAADTIVVGNFCGSVSMAAVGSNGSAISLITQLSIGLSVGTNVLVARSWGRQHMDSVFRAVHSSMALSLLLGIFTGAFGYAIAPELLKLMQVPDNVLPLSVIYLRIYFLGIPATLVYNFGAAVLRAIGDTKRPLYFLTAAGIINVFANLFFVLVMDLDVAGVAIATSLSQYVSAFLVVRCLMRLDNACRFSPKMMRLYKAETLEMLRIGFPAGLQSTIFNVSNVIIQSAINSFGSDVIAGSVAAGNLDNFVYVAMNAFYQAAVSFVSQNVGAGKPERLPRIMWACIGWAAFFGLCLGGDIFVFSNPLLSIYNREPAVIAAGKVKLLWIGVPYFLCGIMEVTCGTVRGLGRSWLPTIVSTIGSCVTRIIWIYTFFAKHRSFSVLCFSYPLSWTLTAAVHLLCALIIMKKLKREYAPSSSQLPRFEY